MVKVASFDDDVQVVHIGHLFRNLGHKEWRIFVWFSPEQAQKWTKFSHLPLLSRSKVLNRTSKSCNTADRVIEFGASDLQRAKLIDFPNLSPFASVRNKDGPQNSFIYEAESLHNKTRYHIPQLELARSLFLINSYFCRSCLSSTALQQEFDVYYEVERDHLEIRVLPSSSFPKGALEQSAVVQLLVWLFSDQEVMDSYESIFRHYQQSREIINKGESWCFSFDPPPMQGWKLHVKGRSSNEGKDYLVEEIVGLELDVRLPSTSRISHAFFQEKEAGEGSTQHIAVPREPVVDDEDLQLDDEETANVETGTRVIEADPTWMSFSRPSQIEKSRRARKSSQIFLEKEGMDIGKSSDLFSTAEPHLGGVLAAADVGGKQDATNYNHVFASRFAAFNELLSILKTKFRCRVIFEETLVLPKVGRSRLHLCKDGSPRVIKAVGVWRNASEFILLEVDASDGVKMLSTKVLIGVNRETWQSDFERIRRGIVRNSLNWPNGLLYQLYGKEGNRGVNHPKGLSELEVSREDMEGWGERLIRE
ncbi:transcriptional antiterminator [Thiopseudomonas alkaliphila]|uniref:Tn7-like element transposition protein TnsE n=1 Tax=Thiopseudomonas alkaliphila TaxID=1697053 RepID=UPI00069EB62B|nr:Tn7-like element transposition protein TnsE [Thiopseudomonas alkaliphila]AKX47328.1 transcriptional antiterminator [Thiopseudomonas alkaliphila]